MSLSTISNCKYPEMPLLSSTPAMLPPSFLKGRDERTTQFLRYCMKNLPFTRMGAFYSRRLSLETCELMPTFRICRFIPTHPRSLIQMIKNHSDLISFVPGGELKYIRICTQSLLYRRNLIPNRPNLSSIHLLQNEEPTAVSKHPAGSSSTIAIDCRSKSSHLLCEHEKATELLFLCSNY